MKLEKKLLLWEQNHLIDEQQYQAILNFEKSNKPKNFGSQALFYLSAFMIGLGIIDIIAFNWEQINDAIKLGGGLFILASVAMIISNLESSRAVNTLTFIYSLMVMGMIGLIGQVYNLHSDIGKGLLFWCFLTFPLMRITPWITWLWIPALWVGVNNLSYRFYFGYDFDGKDLVLILCSACVFLAYEVAVCFRNKISPTALNALQTYSALLLLFAFSATDIRYHEFSQNAWAILAVTTILSFTLNFIRKRTSFMTIFLAALIVSMYFEIIMIPTVLFCSVMGGYAIYHHRKKLYNASIILLAVRIFAFFSVKMELLFAGISLIVYGILLILLVKALNKVWEKYGNESKN